jgi:hypothetical protein
MSPGAYAQITITPGSNSPMTVNGSIPILSIDDPVDGTIDSVSPSYTINFSASVDSFTLGAQTLGDYPCESSFGERGDGRAIIADSSIWKGGGHAIFVILDDGTSRIVTNTSTPAQFALANHSPGPHTLRACVLRSWDESVKDVDSVSPLRRTRLYTVLTFYVDTNTGTQAFDSTLPLLMPNAPLDTNTWVYNPDSVLIDFYVFFKKFEGNYKLRTSIYDSTMTLLERDTLTTWGPHCVSGIPDPPEGHLGKYIIRMQLLDMSGAPVSNGVGDDLNDRQWAFWVRRR